jgi:hypothetical protein
MHQAGNAGRDCFPCHRLGTFHVHSLEGHATLLNVGRDRVDDGLGAGNGSGD